MSTRSLPPSESQPRVNTSRVWGPGSSSMVHPSVPHDTGFPSTCNVAVISAGWQPQSSHSQTAPRFHSTVRGERTMAPSSRSRNSGGTLEQSTPHESDESFELVAPEVTNPVVTNPVVASSVVPPESSSPVPEP